VFVPHNSEELTDICDHSFMTDKFMPLSQALEGYEIFNSMKVQKVVFVPEHDS